MSRTKFANSKLIRILSLLTDKEYGEFGFLLQSPVFNTSNKVIEVYNAIHAFKKDYDIDTLTKQELYNRIYPGKAYKPSHFNNLLSSLFNRLQDYLVWTSNYVEKRKPLIYFSELRKRGEHEFFFKESEKFLIEIKKRESELSSLIIFELYEQLYLHAGNHKKYEIQESTRQLLNDHLDLFFFEKRLALWHEEHTESKIKKIEFDQSEYKYFKSYFSKASSPIIDLYQERIEAIDQINMDTFLKFYEDYLRAYDRLPEIEKRIFLLICINDTVILTAQGRKGASRQLINLYKFGIRENLLFTPEVLTPIMYNNIVSVSIQEKESAFLKNLIWQYRNLLPSDWGEDAMIWAELNIAFAEGKYSSILERLNVHLGKYWLYKLQFNIIKLMAIAELVIQKDYDYSLNAFLNVASTFKRYVERNDKKYKFRTEPYKNFIKFTVSMVKLHAENNSDRSSSFEKLHNKIRQAKLIYRRNWLLDKLSI